MSRFPQGAAKGGKGSKRPQNPVKSIKRLASYIFKHYKAQFFIVVISIILSSLISVVSSVMIQPLIDNYVVPLKGVQNPDLGPFISFIITIGLIYLTGVCLSYLYNRLMINLSQGTIKRIRDEMFIHMQKLPLKFFDNNLNGNIMSTYTNDTDTLRQMLGQSFSQLIVSVFTITGVLVAMIYFSWFLTLIVLVMLLVMTLVVKFIGSNSAKYFIRQQVTMGEVNGYIEEMLEGQKVVKIFNHEEKAKDGFDKVNEKLFADSEKANTFTNMLMPVMDNLSYLTYAITAIVGAIFVSNQTFGLTVGTLMTFLLLTRSFGQPISQISMQMNSIMMALAGAERIFKLLDTEVEVDDGYISLVRAKKNEDGSFTKISSCREPACDISFIWCWMYTNKNGEEVFKELKGDVRFNNVVFSYDGNKVVLNNVNLYAKPGQKIAFVGSTGAGKTTITNLINRFYDIQQGEITYDGLNIKDIKKYDLRKSLGIVLQDTHLFTGTIKDNIKFGKLDATDEEVYAAAKLANADFFINHLPNGYDTIITGDGGNLSQGQRQLLAIARAAIANPPVLILDEATSSIDTRTEKIIEKGMDKLMENRTVFVIAHRLSTVRNSHAIMVLENGQIIERGDHESLLEQKGKYFNLYTGAFELS